VAEAAAVVVAFAVADTVVAAGAAGRERRRTECRSRAVGHLLLAVV
jgi:hypothetical protein